MDPENDNMLPPDELIVQGMALYEAGQLGADGVNWLIILMNNEGVIHNLNDSGCGTSIASER